MDQTTPPDIAALCRQAGVPADDPGAQKLVELVVRECAAICAAAEPEGDADHVSAPHARAVGRELASKLQALFQVW